MQESLPHDTALVKGALRCVFRRTDAQAEVRFQSTFHDDQVFVIVRSVCASSEPIFGI